ncbi:MAG TPA: bifunctional glycosyltransferase family 2/GtrA family protein [Tetrasphaera sp.]|uniref:bifunctional glycosyltransferase family 2/GtrA family protein n=1 Tax=Nostocoides sp. TaxID=1917966 RepID=UPI002CD71D48|nr:bifunctional glycosyltransferase family 2/GtrA family protein [Tetrasphaera sp.]HNQ08739.1 bifunctional glycosyltransferase family 2/GtrA family protein [Tetrasphaera sp.]
MSTYADTIVVIPSLHPEPAFVDLARELAAAGFGEVLVIDDGSGLAFGEVFAAIAASPGCRVLTHPENRGKGAALKTAFADIAARRPDAVVVTADSDGQHTAQGIRTVADRVQAADGARIFVLGARDVDLPHVPLLSRLGNKLTTLVIKALYGQTLPDTQTGLRGIPAALLEPMSRVPGERFDYEMNALTWALSAGVPIVEVPVATIYHDKSNSVSHFRPVRDSVIIYRSIFARAGSYFASSGVAALIDLSVFTLVIDGVFDGRSYLRAVVTATLAARVVSSAVNFLINRHLVFARHGSAWRYYALAFGVLAASALGTTAMSMLLAGHVIWAKIIVDIVLFAVAYHVQRTWVFHGNPGAPKGPDSAQVR